MPWWGLPGKEADLPVRLFEAVLRKHVSMPGAAGPKEFPLQPFQFRLLFRGRGPIEPSDQEMVLPRNS